MKFRLLSLFLLAMPLVACGDESSSVRPNPMELAEVYSASRGQIVNWMQLDDIQCFEVGDNEVWECNFTHSIAASKFVPARALNVNLRLKKLNNGWVRAQ